MNKRISAVAEQLFFKYRDHFSAVQCLVNANVQQSQYQLFSQVNSIWIKAVLAELQIVLINAYTSIFMINKVIEV